MRYVSVSCGTERHKHPKNRPVETVDEAYRFVRSYDPEALNYVCVTVHIVKEDLSAEAFSALLKDVFRVDKTLEWGERGTTRDTQPDQRLAKKHWKPLDLVPGTRLWCTLALAASLALSGGATRAADEVIRPPEPPAFVHQPSPQAPATQTAPSKQDAPASQRQPSAPASDEDWGHVVETAGIGSIISILVGGGVCILSGGLLCMFPMPM